jgi:hypothetical protein
MAFKQRRTQQETQISIPHMTVSPRKDEIDSAVKKV